MFTDTLTRWMQGVKDATTQWNLRKVIEPLFDRMSAACLTNPAIVITAGGAATAKTGAADTYLIINGILVKVTAATVLPVLTGINAIANNFNVACFFVDSAGTITVLGGTQGATIAALKFPQFPKLKALLGFIIVNNGAGVFTGNTTALDVAGTVFINTQEAFDPYCIIGSATP